MPNATQQPQARNKPELKIGPFPGGISVNVWLNTVETDGRAFLPHTSRRWDLIFLDVCTADRLPSHLFTVEALRIVHRRLSPDGILVIQWLGRGGTGVSPVLGGPVALASRQCWVGVRRRSSGRPANPA